MTGAEAIASFKQYYDFVTSFSAPGYTETEILRFLNRAQEELIQRRIFGQNYQPPRFEDIEKRVADISPIVSSEGVTLGINTTTLYGNSWYYHKKNTASGRVLYTLKIDARVTRTRPTLTNEYIRCEKIRSEHAGKFVSSSVNRTHFIEPKYIEEKKGYVLIADYYTTQIDALKLSFILNPYPITASSVEFNGTYSSAYMSLPSQVHREIVEIAVQQAMLTSGDKRWEAKIAEEKQNTN